MQIGKNGETSWNVESVRRMTTLYGKRNNLLDELSPLPTQIEEAKEFSSQQQAGEDIQIPEFIQPLETRVEGAGLNRIEEDEEEFDSEIKTESTFYRLEEK